MFRKYIFLGLMVLLGAVLLSLVLQSRETSPKATRGKAEVVRKSRPTATRVIAPPELEIIEADNVAEGTVALRNNGSYSYRNIRLRLVCRSRGNAESSAIEVKQTIAPGQTLELNKFLSPPSEGARCSATVLYADLSD